MDSLSLGAGTILEVARRRAYRDILGNRLVVPETLVQGHLVDPRIAVGCIGHIVGREMVVVVEIVEELGFAEVVVVWDAV